MCFFSIIYFSKVNSLITMQKIKTRKHLTSCRSNPSRWASVHPWSHQLFTRQRNFALKKRTSALILLLLNINMWARSVKLLFTKYNKKIRSQTPSSQLDRMLLITYSTIHIKTENYQYISLDPNRSSWVRSCHQLHPRENPFILTT